jgi:hypothetical protein
MRRLLLACLIALPLSATAADTPAPQEVQVMILGSFHMANPGRDLHNVSADDVLAPARQKELEDISTALLRFAPTRVAVEWPAAVTTGRYREYRAGTLKPSRNEVVQVAFRLAAMAGLDAVDGIDADGDFPYGPVQEFAQRNGQAGMLQEINDRTTDMLAGLQRVIDTGTLAQALRYMNEPERIANDNVFYRKMLLVGAGDEQPGVDLLTAWYRRNFIICANLLQRTQPGDRVVVVYGAGHSFLLRQCVEETPGYRLVEANDYLP